MNLTLLLAALALAVSLAALWTARSRRSRHRGPSREGGSSSGAPPARTTWPASTVVDGTRASQADHDKLRGQVGLLQEEFRSLAARMADQEVQLSRLRERTPPPLQPGPGPGGHSPAGGGRGDELGVYPAYDEVALDPSPSAFSRPGGDAPLLSTPANARPVELKDGALVLSRSLAAVAVLVEEGAGQARLYVNDQVEIDHMALERWSTFFDFGGGEPYRRYRTELPAVIAWDPASGRGDLRQPGRARSLSA